jgi:hypothetical protein
MSYGVFNLNNHMLGEDFYNIQKIYEDYSSTMQGNYPSINSTSAPGSYNPPAANGPGNEPVNPKGGPPATGDLFQFGGKVSPEKILDRVEQMVQDALDQAADKDMEFAKQVLKPIYKLIVDARTSR